MKKCIVMIMAFVAFSTMVSAQKVVVGGFRGAAVPHYRTHTTVVVGGYNPFYRPWYGYGYYPYARPYYRQALRPTKLDLQIADIKNDYAEKIAAARHDKTVPGKERRANIRELRHDREAAIIDAQRAWYRR